MLCIDYKSDIVARQNSKMLLAKHKWEILGSLLHNEKPLYDPQPLPFVTFCLGLRRIARKDKGTKHIHNVMSFNISFYTIRNEILFKMTL